MTLTPFITLNAEQSNSLLSNNVIQCYTTKKTPFFDVYRIAIRDDAGELVDEQYYLVNTSDSTSFLGQGAFGKVLKAYLLKVDRTNADSQGQTFAVDILHPVVLKCCFEKEDKERQELDLLQEISILHQIAPDVSRGITTVTYANGEIAFVFAQRYIAGKPVKHTALQNQIAKLSITERSLIQLQGMMQIHNFHCQTNQPVLFADIKLENTLLAISVVNGQIQIIFSLIDVGVSLTLTSQNITDIINAMGSIATMAPEVANRQASPKSDIYSYVSIMLYWLGVDEPRVEKAKDRGKLDVSGQIILSNYILKDYLHPGKIILPSINVQTRLQIQVLITKFIMRMMATKVELRADTHESLCFTNTFYHLCLLNDRMQAINHYKENNFHFDNGMISTLISLFQQYDAEKLYVYKQITLAQYSVIQSCTYAEWQDIKSYHHEHMEKFLGKEQQLILNKLTTQEIEFLSGLSISFYDNLKKMTSKEYAQLASNAKQLQSLSLLQIKMLSTILNNKNLIETQLNEFITTELDKLTLQYTQDFHILIAKLAILTTRSLQNDIIDSDTNILSFRSNILNGFALEKHKDTCQLIIAIAMTDKDDYLIDYENPIAVDRLLKSTHEMNLLTDFILDLICYKQDDNRFKAIKTLYGNNYFSKLFIMLFNNPQFIIPANAIAEKLLTVDFSKLSAHMDSINTLLTKIISPSASNFFQANVPSPCYELIQLLEDMQFPAFRNKREFK